MGGLLGPGEVAFHSEDGKAKVPIRLTPANKQAPIVMHVKYKVKLSDHDFVIAKQNKLVPLVNGDMQVKRKLSPWMLLHIQSQLILVFEVQNI